MNGLTMQTGCCQHYAVIQLQSSPMVTLIDGTRVVQDTIPLLVVTELVNLDVEEVRLYRLLAASG